MSVGYYSRLQVYEVNLRAIPVGTRHCFQVGTRHCRVPTYSQVFRQLC